MRKIIPIIFFVIAIVVLTERFAANDESGVLRIACTKDAAGMIVSFAASACNEKITTTPIDQISFLQLTDCCGNQAEVALAAGDFDMAVLCPDAAELFISGTKGFEIVGGIARNTNVLVSKEGIALNAIGYMSGRELQKQAVVKNLSADAIFQPMVAAALPYALETDAVDGIVLDIVNAVKLDAGYICTALPYDGPSSVLVVRSGIFGTTQYEGFIEAYNISVADLNGDKLERTLADFIESDAIEERVNLWREMKVRFINIPNED